MPISLPEELLARISYYGLYVSDGVPTPQYAIDEKTGERKIKSGEWVTLTPGVKHLLKGKDALVLFQKVVNNGLWKDRHFEEGEYKDVFTDISILPPVNVIFPDDDDPVALPLWDEEATTIDVVTADGVTTVELTGIEAVEANLANLSKVYGYSSFEGESGFLFHISLRPGIDNARTSWKWESTPVTKPGQHFQGGKVINTNTLDGDKPRSQRKGTEAALVPSTVPFFLGTEPYQGQAWNWDLPIREEAKPPIPYTQSHSLSFESPYTVDLSSSYINLTNYKDSEEVAKSKAGYRHQRRIRAKFARKTNTGGTSPLGAKGRLRKAHQTRYRVVTLGKYLMLEPDHGPSVLFAKTEPYVLKTDELTGDPQWGLALVALETPIDGLEYLKLFRTLQGEIHQYQSRLQIEETNLALGGHYLRAKAMYIRLMEAHGFRQNSYGNWIKQTYYHNSPHDVKLVLESMGIDWETLPVQDFTATPAYAQDPIFGDEDYSKTNGLVYSPQIQGKWDGEIGGSIPETFPILGNKERKKAKRLARKKNEAIANASRSAQGAVRADLSIKWWKQNVGGNRPKTKLARQRKLLNKVKRGEIQYQAWMFPKSWLKK